MAGVKGKSGGIFSISIGRIPERYEKLAKNGWESSPDYTLSLEYVDRHLMDIDTEYGYGVGDSLTQKSISGINTLIQDRLIILAG